MNAFELCAVTTLIKLTLLCKEKAGNRLPQNDQVKWTNRFVYVCVVSEMEAWRCRFNVFEVQ